MLTCLFALSGFALIACDGSEERVKSDAELALERVDGAANQLQAVFLPAVTIGGERKFRMDAAEIRAAEKALEDLRRAGRETQATIVDRRAEVGDEIVEQIEDYLRFQSGIVDRIEEVVGGILGGEPSGTARRLDAALEDMSQQRSEILGEFASE